MKKVALIGGLLALVGAGSAFGAGQFPGYPLASTISGFEYVPADTGDVATRATFTAGISGNALTVAVSPALVGQLYVGANLQGAGIAPGTVITGGSGNSWTVSPSQTVSAGTAMTAGGGGVNPQTEMIQTQQLRSYVLSGSSISTIVLPTMVTIATLPTCNLARQGARATVSDGTAYATGTYGSAVGASGIVTRGVICTNTAGATTYAWAYN